MYTVCKWNVTQNRMPRLMAAGIILLSLVVASDACVGLDGTRPGFLSVPTDRSKQPRGIALAQTGSQPVLVILVDFLLCPGSFPQDTWKTAWLDTGRLTMRDYYREVSYRAQTGLGLDLPPAPESSGSAVGDTNNGVMGWYSFQFFHPCSLFSTGWENRTEKYLPGIPASCSSAAQRAKWSVSRQLAWLALQAADADVNFAQFDLNSDGAVSANELHLVIVVAGFEASYGAQTPTPNTWAHHYTLPDSGYQSPDGVWVGGADCGSGYAMVGELAPGMPPVRSAMGVVTHEMGHDLGLPDLYDVGLTGDGVGDWCLMGYGSWLGTTSGTTPAQLCAWAKIDEGWLTPTVLWNQDSLNAQVPAVESSAVVYRVNPWQISNSTQYFLIENRQRKLFDSGLPGTGLLIYHIDDMMIAGSRASNTVNMRMGYTNAWHYGVDVECQDGFPYANPPRDHLDSLLDGNYGDPNDPWVQTPWFGPGSTPSDSFYLGVASYAAVESISASGDPMTADFIYYPPPPDTGWSKKESMPAGIKRRKEKDGTCLAYLELNDTGYVFALKGNGMPEFYRHNTATNAWSTRETIPGRGGSGRKVYPKKGASITAAGDKLYAVKGGRTFEFWRYDPNAASSPWQQMASVPRGRRGITEGSGMAGIKIGDTAFVYLAKGSNTTEFYRYDTRNDIWRTMDSLPSGSPARRCKDGTCVTLDSEHDVIYLLKGYYGQLLAYSVAGDSWVVRDSLPAVNQGGTTVRPRHGTGIAYHKGIAYCLKGNKSADFWLYHASSDSWNQGPDIPGLPVKAGGAMVYAAKPNALYVTKGYPTLEFWRFGISVPDFAGPQSGVGMAGFQGAADRGLRTASLWTTPNPFRDVATVSYSLAKPGNVSLRLFDVTGKLTRMVFSGYHPAGSYSYSLITAHCSLAGGVYFLTLDAGGSRATTKLIIE